MDFVAVFVGVQISPRMSGVFLSRLLPPQTSPILDNALKGEDRDKHKIPI